MADCPVTGKTVSAVEYKQEWNRSNLLPLSFLWQRFIFLKGDSMFKDYKESVKAFMEHDTAA